MGSENLIPQNRRTKEEQRAIAKMGGIASGIIRKERKTMRQIAREILAEEITLADGSVVTRGAVIIAQQAKKAAQMQDTNAARFLADLTGDLIQQVELHTEKEIAAQIEKEWENRYGKEEQD